MALGLGFVIFLHELGHFLLAKWNGVKVEKFSIGFGPTLLGFRRGETEYVLAAIPLGGFVKMLGENPEEEASKSTDPRAFQNKSVGARMAIISAGVIMNVILGLACFVFAYGRGMDENPAIIGVVQPGSPAYKAGIRPGDEVVSLDGRGEMNFNTLRMNIVHSSAGQVLHFELKRPGIDAPVKVDVEPLRLKDSPYPNIGILPSNSLRIYSSPSIVPSGMNLTADQYKSLDLMPGDVLVALGPVGEAPKPVSSALELDQLLATYRSKPVSFVFERKLKSNNAKEEPKTSKVTLTLPPNHIVDLGLRMTIQPIQAIRPGSPAEKAGFLAKDLIITVDGKNDFDPMQLGDYCFDRAGQNVMFEVERVSNNGKPERVSLTVVPDSTPPEFAVTKDSPQDLPAIGIAYGVLSKVASVRAGSPAEKAGVVVGDEIVKLTLPPQATVKNAKPSEFPLGSKTDAWPAAFASMQYISERTEPLVELSVKRLAKPLKIRPEQEGEWYSNSRGLQFGALIRRLPPQPAGAALRRGADDTLDNILKIYMLLRSLFQGRVSPTLLGGPIMIAQAAYSQAESGLTELVHFLGLLSINLAVLNFLPVPPLDGGQMVFLIAEKVRGKPLPESAVAAGSYVGIIMLLCLMAYVMFQDVWRSFF
ncbi:site-2 protease family protein [Singulisphaera sp. PoT]|uniref:site-2 protease family protein n=1 Tax=Singulisphaera sp. PoT TaxID=3411797 RepID=UPI003BF54973